MGTVQHREMNNRRSNYPSSFPKPGISVSSQKWDVFLLEISPPFLAG